ncbi:MAG TPA: branched-chain amino acid aminotransferase [Thermoanaerobaculia bacterium]|nr:branched-chain amino acid aminotransferase [Thermoanaerobaculia bacterium]
MIRIANLSAQRTPPYSLDPQDIEFGRICTPNFFLVEYRGGRWQDPRVEALHGFTLHPATNVFHYAQAIFEGLKAYRQSDDKVALFRPEMNARRFNESAARMGMPAVDEQLFVEAIRRLVDIERAFVPQAPGSLYIRPTMIGTEACLGVRSSNEFLFYVITLPSGAYFKEMAAGTGTVRVYVEQATSRAAPGGTGGVKAAANYAVTLKSITVAKERGCSQVLFLDAARRHRVEELGGMNVFFVRNGELMTPTLNGTILAGVTRDSLLAIGPSLGIPASETDIDIDEVIEGVQSGAITEAIACGTAATVVGISELVFSDGRVFEIGGGKLGPVTKRLFDEIQAIQFGTEPDRFGWTSQVEVSEVISAGA